MCRLRLGLKAPALAWLWVAQALLNHEPGQKPKVQPGLAWLWLRPGLWANILDFAYLCRKIDVSIYQYIITIIIKLFYT
jgi:hypothetical protein